MRVVKKMCVISIVMLSMISIFTSNIYIVDARQTKYVVDGGGSVNDSTVSSSVSSVGSGTAVTSDTAQSISPVIKKVLGMLRLLTGLLSIIVIAYTGFEMVTETPEGKKKVKEKMIPIIIGVVLVFMATTIATFIVGVFEGNETTAGSGGSTSYEAVY